jgi:hypothetical protein
MKTRIHWLCIVLISFSVILFSLSFTSPVLADTETPPEATPQTEVSPTPMDEVTPTTEVADPTVEPTVEATETAVVEPTTEPTETAETLTPEQALVEVLNENDIVLTDENGDVIPLASEDASVLAEGADPYFIAGGIYYGYSSGLTCNALVLPANCQTSVANPVSAAITAYTTTYVATATGAIFIDAGSYTEAASINVTSGSNLTGLIGAGSATTTITFTSGNLSIANTIKGFTLQGLTINGNIDSTAGNALVDFSNNTGALAITDVVFRNTNTEGDGLEVTGQTGAVTVKTSSSNNNGDEGAKITASGAVTITASSFDKSNGGNNLTVTSTAGAITLNGVSASNNNAGSGAVLSAKTGVKITNSTFSNNLSGAGLVFVENSAGPIVLDSVFANNNANENIYVYRTDGAVTMTNVEAKASTTAYGIYIDNCDSSGTICQSPVAGAITLTNVDASGNRMTNIYVVGSGAITMTGITANDSNVGMDLAVDNHYAKAVSPVTLSTVQANSASSQGVHITSRGAVTLNAITAGGAGSYGISVDNTSGTGAVTILKTLGRTTVSGNGDKGIVINSAGSVTIAGLDAVMNHNYGAQITTTIGTGNVSITDSTFSSQTVWLAHGLEVSSKGAITLTNVQAVSNNGYGVTLYNNGSATPKPITLTNCTFMSNNDGNGIYSKGNITLTSVTAADNNTSTHIINGMDLSNTWGTGTVTVTKSSSDGSNVGFTIFSNGSVLLDTVSASGNDTYGVLINNSTSTIPTVTVTIKKGLFDSNGAEGLNVLSLGLITVNSTSASDNNVAGSYGATLDNSTGTGGVTMTGTATAKNYFDGNNTHGLSILTNGVVNLNYLDVQGNGGIGVNIVDNGTGAITIANINASGNGHSGLFVDGKGAITVTNPVISGNTDALVGVSLDNRDGTGGVTLQGTSSTVLGYFNANTDGLSGTNVVIDTNGAVTVKYISISASHDQGLNINNASAGPTPSGAPVTLTGVTVTGTTFGPGFEVGSTGLVTMTGVTVSGNSGMGLIISNSSTLNRNVVLTNITANGNGGDGISVTSTGSVLVYGATANASTSGSGIGVNNSSGTGSVTITNSGAITNNFNGNFGYGVYVNTRGAVTVNKVAAAGNHQSNISISNSTGSGSVTMSNITSNGSLASGASVVTSGEVTITGFNASGNTTSGLIIQNATTGANVAVTNTTVTGSLTSYGIYIDSRGFVTLTNVSSSSNATDGIRVENSTGLGVTLQNSGTLMNNCNGNSGYGVMIYTNGPIKVTNTVANTNSQSGVYLHTLSTTAAITLTNVTASATSDYGIAAYANGNITGTNIKGTGNASYSGIFLNNCQDLGAGCNGNGYVNLNGVTASDSTTGLVVYSKGAITLANAVLTNNTTGCGAVLDNHLNDTSPIFPGISVLKANASGNRNYGLLIYTMGNTILDGVTAVGNYGPGTNGVMVDNSYAGATGNVSVLSTKGANNFSNNSLSGLVITTNGAVVINNATANFNGQDGIAVSTYGLGKAINATNVTVKGNAYNGFSGYATADSVFTNIKAIDNGILNSDSDGIYMEMDDKNFTISNSFIYGNGQNGLEVVTGTGNIVKVINTFCFGNDHYGYGMTGVKNIQTGAILQIL